MFPGDGGDGANVEQRDKERQCKIQEAAMESLEKQLEEANETVEQLQRQLKEVQARDEQPVKESAILNVVENEFHTPPRPKMKAKKGKENVPAVNYVSKTVLFSS